MIATTEPGYTGILTPDSDLRRALFGDSVMRHPAKQHLPQLAHIAKRLQDYGIEPMSNIMDCFGGAGSAMLLCSGQHGGHNVCTIELAAHFRELQRQAWEHFSCSLDMADIYDVPPGVFVSLAGDSRQIPQVLAAAGMREGEQLDCVVSSPPYADALHHDQVGAAIKRIRAERGSQGMGQTSIPQTYDAVVTSPSYGGSEAVDKRKKQNTTIAAHGGGNLAKLRYDKAELARNADAPQIDAVITSPPYHNAMHNHDDAHKLDSLPERFQKSRAPHSQVNFGAYSNDAENIGNETGKKYLASMAQVWAGAAQVLRPGGILVCITRDCVKRGKRVPVGEQNRALIEAAGLTFLECETWKVDRLSFWRILQARKNPDAPIIDSEEVMYFRKP